MDALGYGPAYARLIVLARAIQATPVEELVAFVDRWHADNPGFNDPKARELARARVGASEAVIRAALQFKQVVDRVLPVRQEVRVL